MRHENLKASANVQSWLEIYLKNKFTFLLISILSLFVIEPFIRPEDFPLLPFFLFLMILSVLWALNLKPVFFYPCAFLAVCALCFDALVARHGVRALDLVEPIWPVYLVLTVYVLFMFAAIKLMAWRIFTTQSVSLDTLQGGISIYFLMGIFWALLYQLILVGDPNAIKYPGEAPHFYDLFYFSFVTLTTVGYGDLMPVSALARNLSILEAACGQIFLTVFIARLVGLHLVAASKAEP